MKDTIVPLKIPVAKLVIKDLIQGDGNKQELKESYKVIDLQKSQIGLFKQKDSLKDQKISNLDLIITKKDQQFDLERQKSESLLGELKNEKKKTFLYKLGTYAAAIVSVLYLVKYMKEILNIKNIVIVILLLIAIIEFINPKGFLPNRTKLVLQIDSIPYDVHDTIGVEMPVEVQVEVEKLVPYAVHDTFQTKVDTMALLNSIGVKSFKKDVLKLPNNVGTITIFDTIATNKIVGRSYKSDIKQRIIRDTAYLGDARRNMYYVGLDANLDKRNVINLIGIGFMIKDKDAKHIYKIGAGVSNVVGSDGTNGILVPYIGGSVYWRVKSK